MYIDAVRGAAYRSGPATVGVAGGGSGPTKIQAGAGEPTGMPTG